MSSLGEVMVRPLMAVKSIVQSGVRMEWSVWKDLVSIASAQVKRAERQWVIVGGEGMGGSIAKDRGRL